MVEGSASLFTGNLQGELQITGLFTGMAAVYTADAARCQPECARVLGCGVLEALLVADVEHILPLSSLYCRFSPGEKTSQAQTPISDMNSGFTALEKNQSACFGRNMTPVR